MGDFMHITGDMARTIISLGAALTAIIALILQTARSRSTSQADILLKLDQRFLSKEIKELRKVAAQKLLDKNPDNEELSDVLDFFTNVAYLVELKALDVTMAYLPFSYWILRYWKASELYIKQQREIDPNTWKILEGLNSKFVRHKKSKYLKLNEELMIKFLHEEASLRIS